MGALEIASLVIELLSKGAPIAIHAVTDAKPFAMDLWAKLSGQPPTAADEAAIDAALAELSARLAAPLSPAQPGDPDYVPPAA